MDEHMNLAELPEWKRSVFANSSSKCVFISHKKEDEAAAIDIGNYLLHTVGVNIYLDVKDCELKEAVSLENDKKIVSSIERGLECSTHLLCIVSEKTRLSWWVPFEIGYAEKRAIDIASLKLKLIDDIPSYLKIKKVLYNNKRDFLKYASEIGPLSDYFAASRFLSYTKSDCSLIEKHIDKGGI